MDFLNFHHLRYFYAIVREGTLTAASRQLNISQSSISVQLKQLEQDLGCPLFERVNKRLKLTEEGRIVFDYAESIFASSREMLATLRHKDRRFRSEVRVGAVATLSRNFQLSILRDVILDDEVEVIIESGSWGELLNRLADLTLDVVLSNRAAIGDAHRPFRSHLLDRQQVSLIGNAERLSKDGFRFPQDLENVPLILPSLTTEIRQRFDERIGSTRLLVAAEADDMAMLRLLAREMDAIALLPPVVVKDELETKALHELYRIPDLFEDFYAITVDRRYPNPVLQKVIAL